MRSQVRRKIAVVIVLALMAIVANSLVGAGVARWRISSARAASAG